MTSRSNASEGSSHGKLKLATVATASRAVASAAVGRAAPRPNRQTPAKAANAAWNARMRSSEKHWLSVANGSAHDRPRWSSGKSTRL
jgi:hypothetical protein